MVTNMFDNNLCIATQVLFVYKTTYTKHSGHCIVHCGIYTMANKPDWEGGGNYKWDRPVLVND